MSDQESPATSSSLLPYRVRRRHGSWDLRTSNTSLTTLSGNRISSQPDVCSTSQQHVARIDARKPSSNGWTTELPATKDRHGASCSPKSGEKTVAQLRQRFEQRTFQDEGVMGVPEGQHRGHRRSRSIRTSLVPIAREKVEHQARDGESTAQRAYTLPPFSFSPASEQPAEPISSSAFLEQDTQGETLPVLQLLVYTGHHDSRTASARAPMRDDNAPVPNEDLTMTQTGSADNPHAPADTLAATEDGVKVINCAYVQATDLSSSSAPGSKHVRFASKPDYAPSVHHESSSDNSTQSSTTDLIDLGEYNGTPPVVRRSESRLGMYDDASDSKNEGLLLLTSSMYQPQPVCPDGIVEDFDDQEDLQILPVQEAESLETAMDNVDENREQLSAVERKDSEHQTSVHNEVEEDLTLLLASVYTPPGHIADHSGKGANDSDPEASTSGEHSGEEDIITVPPASASASLDHTDVLPGLCEADNDIRGAVVEDRTPSEAVPSSDERADHKEARPRRKRRKFIRHLLRGTAFPEGGDKANQGTSRSRPSTLRRRIGRRLGKSVLLLIMWKRW